MFTSNLFPSSPRPFTLSVNALIDPSPANAALPSPMKLSPSFFDCSNITGTIPDASNVGINTYVYGSSFVDDDIIGVYLDLDNNKLYFSENGTLYSSTGIDITAAASTLNGHYHIGASDASANDNGEYLANYGGCPAFTISSAVSDDNGYGSFEYSPNITGDSEAKKFYALCTKNLAEFG